MNAHNFAPGAHNILLFHQLFELARQGNAEGVRTIIEQCTPPLGYGFDKALVIAAQYGHVACVQQLCAVANPLYRNSLALQQAVFNSQWACVEVLCPISNVGAALETLKKTHPKHHGTVVLEQYATARQQQQTLREAVDGVQGNTGVRKI